MDDSPNAIRETLAAWWAPIAGVATAIATVGGWLGRRYLTMLRHIHKLDKRMTAVEHRVSALNGDVDLLAELQDKSAASADEVRGKLAAIETHLEWLVSAEQKRQGSGR